MFGTYYAFWLFYAAENSVGKLVKSERMLFLLLLKHHVNL